MKKPTCKYCLGTGKSEKRKRNAWKAYHYMRDNFVELRPLTFSQILDKLFELGIYKFDYNRADKLMAVENFYHRLVNLNSRKGVGK